MLPSSQVGVVMLFAFEQLVGAAAQAACGVLRLVGLFLQVTSTRCLCRNSFCESLWPFSCNLGSLCLWEEMRTGPLVLWVGLKLGTPRALPLLVINRLRFQQLSEPWLAMSNEWPRNSDLLLLLAVGWPWCEGGGTSSGKQFL